MILPISGKWYNMIRTGIKTEEYRAIKPYWQKRIEPLIPYAGKKYVYEHLRNGYGKDRPTLLVYGFWDVGFGVPKWGAPADEEVFRFHILTVKELKS
ncbi:MAG TPA: hypothetical protein PKN39_02385 [Oscillospiraceae bacterium]|nr:hypothetical protein [Oscillospiraceae bacterium]